MTLPAGFEFNIDDPSIVDDPYQTYAQLRSACPVGYTSNRDGYWYIADYDTLWKAFRNSEVFSSEHVKIPAVPDPLGHEIPLELDGEEHSAWRRLLDPLFSRSRVMEFSDEIRAQASTLLREFVESGQGDFVQGFSVPYPSRIFCLMMGLPPNGLDQYLNWGRALAKVTSQEDAVAAVAAFQQACDGVIATFESIKDERLANGLRDDVVSLLAIAEVDGRRIDDREFQSVCRLLFVAGLETVTSTLGNIMLFLAEHPEHVEMLRSDPDIIPRAVEEFLRYESIVSLGRVVTRDVDLQGQHLHAGDRVMLLTGSAGRDEKVFDAPDEVRFDRESTRHLAFGVGPHRCLGSHLARVELRIFLEELITIMPEFHVTEGEIPERSMGLIKTVELLPLTVGR